MFKLYESGRFSLCCRYTCCFGHKPLPSCFPSRFQDRRVRLDYQEPALLLSPSCSRGGTWTGLERAAEIEPRQVLVDAFQLAMSFTCTFIVLKIKLFHTRTCFETKVERNLEMVYSVTFYLMYHMVTRLWRAFYV